MPCACTNPPIAKPRTFTPQVTRESASVTSSDASPPIYREWPAPPELSPWIRCVWGLSAQNAVGAPAPEPIVPDGCPEIILNLADPFQRELASGETALQPQLMYVGQITGPMRVGPSGLCRVVGIRLQPWSGHAVTGVEAVEMRDQEVAWGDLGSRPSGVRGPVSASLLDALSERLSELPIDGWGPEVFRSVGRQLLADSPRGRYAGLASKVVAEIERTSGRITVRSVARRLYSSERTVQRVMRESVGLSPVVLGRILRFQSALGQLISDPAISLGRVAVASGYHDQPHFNREFRRLTGTTPSSFLGTDRSLTDHFVGG